MAKKRALTLMLGGIATLATTVGVAIGASFANAEQAQELPDKAYFGQTIEIPEKALTYNGQSKTASAVVTAPNGGSFTGESFTVNEFGLYTVEYIATFDGGKTVSEKDTISAVRRNYDLFQTNAYAAVENGVYKYKEEYKGVRASLRSGGELTFTKHVDISKLTKDDLFLEMIIEPSSIGDIDFSKFTITMTDLADRDNYIEITGVDSGLVNGGGKLTYVKAGTPNQTAGGYEGPKYNTLPQFGCPILHTFRGFEESVWEKNYTTYPTLQLYYDNAEKAVYASYGSDYRTPGKTIVADLDDPTIYPSNPWAGFEGKEVEITISAGGHTSATANILLMNVAGYNLANQEFVDTAAPAITVDYAGETDIPKAVVNSEYKVFNAEYYDDLDNEIFTDVSAYYLDVASNQRYDVAIVDGKIKTAIGGTYILCYTATDRSGNTAQEEVRISCIPKGNPIELDATDENSSVTVYEKVTIHGLDGLTAQGGSGKLHCSVSVYAPNGETVSLIKNAFIPTQVGEYKIVYTATDYLGASAKIERTVTVSAPTKPILIEKPTLPDVLIKGFTYALPICEAVENAASGLAFVSVKTYVNGAETENAFTANGENVTIRYVASGATGNGEYEVTLPVVDGNNGKDQVAYFYGEGVTATSNKEDISVAFAPNASFLFANALSSANFRLSFSVDTLTSDFESILIVLTDAKNENLSVTLRLALKNGKLVLYTPHSENGFEIGARDADYSLNYNNASFVLKDITDATCGKILYDDAGDAFTGFSDLVYFSMQTVGGEKTNTISFTTLNNQSLGHRKNNYEKRVDEIAPEIYLESSYAVKQSIGATANVSAGKAYDVLGYITSFTVTVTAPDGSKVLDGVSAEQHYTFSLTQYGNYRVYYNASDSNGNPIEYMKLIRVVEKEKPVLKFSDQLQEKYKVGDVVNIPTYTVSDNSGGYSVDVMLIMPDNSMRMLLRNVNGTEKSNLTAESDVFDSAFKAGDRAFKALEEGKYVLRFFVYDENYNYVMTDMEFTVK